MTIPAPTATDDFEPDRIAPTSWYTRVTKMAELPQHVLDGPWWFASSTKFPKSNWSQPNSGTSYKEAYAQALLFGWNLLLKMDAGHGIYVIDIDPTNKDGKLRDPVWLKRHAEFVEAATGGTYIEHSSQRSGGYHIVGLLPQHAPWSSKRNGPAGSGLELFAHQGIVAWTHDRKGENLKLEMLAASEIANLSKIFVPFDETAAGPRKQGDGAPMAADELRSRLRNTGDLYAAYLDGPAHTDFKGDCNADLANFGQCLATYTAGCSNQREVMEEVLFSSYFALKHTPATSEDNPDRFTNKAKLKVLRTTQFDKFIRWGDNPDPDPDGNAVARKIAANSMEARRIREEAGLLKSGLRRESPPTGSIEDKKTEVADGDGLILEFAMEGDTTTAAMEFLRDPILPVPGVVNFSGRGGTAKSSVAATLAAEISDKVSTLWLTTEEDISHIKTRHIKSGGKAGTLAVLAGTPMKHDRQGNVIASSVNVFEHLDLAIAKMQATQKKNNLPPVKLVVLDTVVGLTAWAKGESPNDEASVKKLLGFLKNICEQNGITLIAILHDNKGGHAHTADRVAGSAAWVNHPRLTIHFAACTEGDYCFVAQTVKASFGSFGFLYGTKPIHTLYTRDEDGVPDVALVKAEIGEVVWGNAGVAELVAGVITDGPPKKGRKSEECRDHILEMLLTGPKLSTTAILELTEQGFTTDMANKVSTKLKQDGEVHKEKKMGGGITPDYWIWHRPGYPVRKNEDGSIMHDLRGDAVPLVPPKPSSNGAAT